MARLLRAINTEDNAMPAQPGGINQVWVNSNAVCVPPALFKQKISQHALLNIQIMKTL
jgi:hypothetical protein